MVIRLRKGVAGLKERLHDSLGKSGAVARFFPGWLNTEPKSRDIVQDTIAI